MSEDIFLYKLTSLMLGQAGYLDVPKDDKKTKSRSIKKNYLKIKSTPFVNSLISND